MKPRNALITSMLAMLLCVAMLVGSTFAWFTDTASTGVNKIRAGELDVEMEYARPGATAWTPVDEKTQLFSSTGWEPGYTQVVYIRVKNNGTLALKHAMAVNIVGESEVTNVAGEKMRLSQYLQADLKELQSDPTTSALTTDREQIGVNTSVSSPDKNIRALRHSGGILPPGEAQIYQMTVYFPTTVGNEANYRGRIAPAITFGLKVTASQAVYESDSFGSRYDETAPEFVSVSNAKEFEQVFVDAKPGEDLYVLLENDIDLNGGFVRIIREKHNNRVGVGVGDVVINGNGHKITTNYSGGSGVVNVEYAEANRSITLLDTVIQSNGVNTSGGQTCGAAVF